MRVSAVCQPLAFSQRARIGTLDSLVSCCNACERYTNPAFGPRSPASVVPAFRCCVVHPLRDGSHCRWACFHPSPWSKPSCSLSPLSSSHLDRFVLFALLPVHHLRAQLSPLAPSFHPSSRLALTLSSEYNHRPLQPWSIAFQRHSGSLCIAYAHGYIPFQR